MAMIPTNSRTAAAEEVFQQLERAIIQLRSGEENIAREVLHRIRATDASLKDIRVAIWVMLIEGLLGYFASADSVSRDRIYRAYALSEAAGSNEMISRTAAWKAHAHFEVGEFESAVESLNRSFAVQEAAPDDAKSRAFMVAALLFSCAARHSEAEVYYREARRLSTATSDRATISAIMYNQAAFMINDLRLSRVLKRACTVSPTVASMMLSSSVNFDTSTGATALIGVTRVLRARMFLLQGSFRTAKRLLINQGLVLMKSADMVRRTALRLDIAWCGLELNELDEAKKSLDSVRAAGVDLLDIDDAVVYYSLLTKFYDLTGDSNQLLDSREGLRNAAGAGGAAHLPGMLAAKTTVPVLGVPVSSKQLSGVDSLYSIVQMPKGIPVATFAIGPAGAANAALFAVAMLALDDAALLQRLNDFRAQQTAAARAMTQDLKR
jgi:tetratricopeptide (TPR) repeat protein